MGESCGNGPCAAADNGDSHGQYDWCAERRLVTDDLYIVNRAKLEALIDKIFGGARLDIEVKDRFGQPVVPREWRLAPLFVINEAVERIRYGTIAGYVYDPKSATLTVAGDFGR